MDAVLPGLDLIKEGVFSRMIQFCALLVCHLQLWEVRQLNKPSTLIIQNKLTGSYSFCLFISDLLLDKYHFTALPLWSKFSFLTIVTR